GTRALEGHIPGIPPPSPNQSQTDAGKLPQPMKPEPATAALPKTLAAPPAVSPATPAQPTASDVLPAVPTREAQPVGPPSLHVFLTRQINIEVRLSIDATGKVVQAQAQHIDGALEASLARIAVDAARLWRFAPAIQDGRPVASATNIQFTFKPGR